MLSDVLAHTPQHLDVFTYSFLYFNYVKKLN